MKKGKIILLNELTDVFEIKYFSLPQFHMDYSDLRSDYLTHVGEGYWMPFKFKGEINKISNSILFINELNNIMKLTGCEIDIDKKVINFKHAHIL